MLQFISYFEADGIECVVSPLFSDAYLETLYRSGRRSKRASAAAYLRRVAAIARSARYDCLWIEKELFPFLPATAERILARCGMPFVVDFDDAVFHNYD